MDIFCQASSVSSVCAGLQKKGRQVTLLAVEHAKTHGPYSVEDAAISIRVADGCFGGGASCQ